MELEFLKTLVLLFGVSASVIFLLNKARIPPLVGFLIAGVFVGPHGFGLIRNLREVELLAEIGVILLLFTVGLEISLKNLKKVRSSIFGGGISQVLLTIIVTSLLTYPFLLQWNKALFSGFLVALSSTAIVMKILFDRGEIDSPHGRLSIGILIFQDLCVVPLMLFIPIISGTKGSSFEFLWTLLKSAVLLFIIIFGARWLVPNILHQIVRTRSRELFIITIILLCLGTALMTSSFGLSLALGAFLAGLIISESEYAYQAISDILPFKESFNGLFFVSIGMLMDLRFLYQHIPLLFVGVLLILFIKTVIATLSVHLIGHPLRISFQTGLHLSQIGEFSFILATAGKSVNLISDAHYQVFLSTSILTMFLTPFILRASPRLSAWLISKRLVERLDRMRRRANQEGYPLRREDHVIIVGFGLNGKNLAEVLKATSIPYVILDLNNETVLEMRKKGEPIFYGDGTSPEILHKLGISVARLLVVAISDPTSTQRIVQIARKENPRLYIIVRTRYAAEVEELLRIGANEVIPEEFETSIEIFAKVLNRYQVPRNFIMDQIENIRKGSYEMLRRVELPVKSLPEKCEVISDIEVETYLIMKGSPLEGRSIKDIQIHTPKGVTIIAVKRGEEIFPSPEPDFVFKAGDLLYLIGGKEVILEAFKLFEPSFPS
ncbi:MAG: cation:proton antiporter domain-containing protein [Thermodesulfobacteriota bacterium]